ncbi:MAG: N-acetylmuramoyl-L-alanine amidase [Deltaproteobacteria bacterium]|nr:N-acetylmuramoyl-L-alanine amidase [Deltaproteobacteria bacterium]MBW2389253.1 N-acetylmuramoyl-L-alanine amidase [Deltaproteobacteria bacterium]MBW2724611.1 N-acetylmuramoyl-L-alanine amidase [Deltaproteobacteria bacterium]
MIKRSDRAIAARTRRSGVFLALAVVVLGSAAPAASETASQAAFARVVIDAGHGGKDEGATGKNGVLEKEIVLDVSRRLAKILEANRLDVILTRETDRFVPLEVRTARANDARGDLFVSIHANAASARQARGIETYFVSLEASDAASRLVADRENEALGRGGPASPQFDPFLALLGDMISTDHLADSNAFAKLAQAELANVDQISSRGVKQAPFVVLMGVQMPAALVEIGFLSNRRDAASLGTTAHRKRIAEALARAVMAFGKRYDARRGLAAIRE